MSSLAQIILDTFWVLMSVNDDYIDPDFQLKLVTEIYNKMLELPQEEQQALADAATATKARLMAEPDAYGYSPRMTVTEDQLKYLESLIDGQFFNPHSSPE